MICDSHSMVVELCSYLQLFIKIFPLSFVVFGDKKKEDGNECFSLMMFILAELLAQGFDLGG